MKNIYGETVELFGDGVYANNFMLKAVTAKGSDLVMLLVSFGFLVCTLKRNTGQKVKLIHGGFLVSLLYHAATTAFGIAYNRMFLLYLFRFSAAFFAFVAVMIDLNATIQPANKEKKYTGTAIFTMVAGSTALVWLMSILPPLFTNAPLDIIDISTTEPTFIIDIGLIFPTCLVGGIMLPRKKPIGYILPPIMLTFLSVIAVTVIGQTAIQLHYGVIIFIQQVIGYVATFVVFGLIAAIVNTRFMLSCWPISQKTERLETGRLIIRSFTPDDWQDLYEYLSQPETVKYEPYKPFSLDEAKRESRRRSADKNFCAVVLKENGKVIGNVYLTKRSFDDWEIGFVFNSYFGHNGYATEAAKALIDKAFAEFKAHRIFAECNPQNDRSWKLLERLNFKREGHLSQNIFFKRDTQGHPIWQDTYVYGVLVSEWNTEIA
ncbi:hypothetical protein FACS189450_06280 [Spirochaetia bacterium]|nr:hypothetical protein FACS189450_06280 [Spirochaetia bacterium]